MQNSGSNLNIKQYIRAGEGITWQEGTSKDQGPSYQPRITPKDGYRYSRKEYFSEFGSRANITMIKQNFTKSQLEKGRRLSESCEQSLQATTIASR